MIRPLLENYIMENAGITAEKLNEENLTMADLGLDSLGIVEMLFEIEEKYGFRLEDVMKYGAMSFNDVVADIERQVAQHGLNVQALAAQAGMVPEISGAN